MKISQFIIILIGSIITSTTSKAAEPAPIFSESLRTGNQISKVVRLGGLDHDVTIDGKFKYDIKTKFIESEVRFNVTNQRDHDWNNSLKSKFQLRFVSSKNEVYFVGSESKYINYNGWTAAAHNTSKYDSVTKKYEISFWAIFVYGGMSSPEAISKLTGFPEGAESKRIKIEDNEGIIVYLGNIITYKFE